MGSQRVGHDWATFIFFFFLSASSHFKHMKATKLESREFTDFGKCWTSVAFSPFSYPHHGQGRASSPFSPVLWEAGCLRRHSKRLIMMLMVDAALDPAETSKARGCRGKLRLLCRERETGLNWGLISANISPREPPGSFHTWELHKGSHEEKS